MSNEIRVFESVEFGKVRTVDVNGEVYFVGKDICEAFGDKNHNRSLGRIDEIDKRVVEIVDSIGRKQKAVTINESGMYALLFSMQPQKANNNGVSNAYPIEVKERIEKLHKFKHWVTSEVLPSIRKTGGYVANEDMFINTYLPFADETTKMLFKNTLAVVQNQNKLIEKQKKEITHKANVIQGFADNISLADKRQIINQVMRYNTTNHAGKWNMLYTEFDKAYHMDTKTRLENHITKGNTPKYKNRIDYIDKHLNMLNELYAVAVKLFESDVEQIKARYDVYSNIA